MIAYKPTEGTAKEVADWWETKIIDMVPGEIRYHGYPIEELIGNLSFTDMIWLMVRGERPTQTQGRLLDAALMSAVDHGPQAPSIAIARMAATCGVGLNNAIASAVNVLGDVHGGAGEQAVSIYQDIAYQIDNGQSLKEATDTVLTSFIEDNGKYIPGFGHRFHPIDPRAPKLIDLVRQHTNGKEVTGRFADIAEAIEENLFARKGKRIPMNIDGATAVIYAELGMPAELARGLFCLSRSVGILSHAWEQTCQGGRNKGPIPRNILWTYSGKKQRAYQRDEE
jgi:citrate synthase